VRYVNHALHKETGTVALHLAKQQANSSIFQPDHDLLIRFPEAERFEILRTIQVAVDCLDRQLQEHGVADPDFIKADTQGSELLVLQGGKLALSSAIFGLEVEAEFIPIYRDQPLFADLDTFLRGFGFHLFDLRPVFWKRSHGCNVGGTKGQIIYADALYLRSPQTFLPLLDRMPDAEARKAKLLRAISICILYGYLDYALEVLDFAGGVLSEGERKLAEQALTAGRTGRDWIPHFRGRRRIADALHFLWQLLDPVQAQPMVQYFQERGWATGLRALGNSDS
jgi:FkbM family methyltransferase